MSLVYNDRHQHTPEYIRALEDRQAEQLRRTYNPTHPCDKYRFVNWTLVLVGIFVGMVLHRLSKTLFHTPASCAVSALCGHMFGDCRMYAYSFGAGVVLGSFCHDGFVKMMLYVGGLLKCFVAPESGAPVRRIRDASTGRNYLVIDD